MDTQQQQTWQQTDTQCRDGRSSPADIGTSEGASLQLCAVCPAGTGEDTGSSGTQEDTGSSVAEKDDAEQDSETNCQESGKGKGRERARAKQRSSLPQEGVRLTHQIVTRVMIVSQRWWLITSRLSSSLTCPAPTQPHNTHNIICTCTYIHVAITCKFKIDTSFGSYLLRRIKTSGNIIRLVVSILNFVAISIPSHTKIFKNVQIHVMYMYVWY